ncbi:uncharacterized protein I303_107327 [Kwoniella dejecticola CBS 10117]|uniref:STE/STE11/SSK protein kinase n=1 Tax=Kwoniella dejecticola CBS 10117 TaxID=1296121 RepID=A0A1A5ZZD8_9TREE|nr:STE/STE11/SSK protein kinase [Kwoniella dejecticola CBS 10117]OBR83173.1 STE/STE11/SSK protein kinase [Kwoniella dejecticola CBS 10117]
MSNPNSPQSTDPVPLSGAHVPHAGSNHIPPASSAKTGGRRSVRLFAPDADSSSEDEDDGSLLGKNLRSQETGGEGAPPTNARSSSYPGPNASTSPTSRISAIVSSASAAQPKLARSATFVGSSASASSSTRPSFTHSPIHASGSAQTPGAGLHHENRRLRSRRPESISRSYHNPDGQSPAGSGGSRGHSDVYNDPEASYFHNHAGPSRKGRKDMESDDEHDEMRSSGWQMGATQVGPGKALVERRAEVSDSNNTQQQLQMALSRVDVSSEEKQERLDWQGMLESVLTSDVLKVEEARISQAMPTESFREEFGQSLWWQIRAKLRGRTEAEEKRRVHERRARVVDSVLEEVATFKAKPFVPSIPAQDEDLGPQHSALDQVNLILAKLAAIKALYPNLAAMRADKPTYASPEFRSKTDALTAWSTIVTALQTQLKLLQKWTGSDELDITKPNTTKEKALTDKNMYTYHPLDNAKSGLTAGPNAADDSSFLDRVMKEDNLQKMFERRAFVDLISLIKNAKQTVIDFLPIFQEQNLPDFQYELVRLIGFPGRLIIEALKVRLDAAARLVDPNPMVVSDFIDNLRLSISLAVLIRKQYDSFIKPDENGHWAIPHCLPPEYNDVMIDAMKAFFKLLHWRLRGVGRGSYFKETEVLEDEGPFLYEAAEAIEGGDMVVAEHSCALSNKLLIRSCNYLDQQLRVPSLQGNPNAYGRDAASKAMKTDEMASWYGKLLDSARMRHRKTQRYCRRLTQRFDNSAEYSLEQTEVDALVTQLQESGHFLVYTNVFESKGTYIVADGALWGQPDDVRHLLQRAFSVTIPGARNRPRRTATSSQDGDVAGTQNPDGTPEVQAVDEGEDSDEEDLSHIASYLLLLSPRQNFVWTGAVMTLDVDYIEYSLQDNRVRLIADGPTSRLALCKHLFAESLIEPETGDSLYLPCLVEAQAHLPSIQGQLLKIAKSSYRLSECIVQSAPTVRNAFRGAPGSQDLVENWYSFATDHGTRVSTHIDPASWERFSRLLMRLAISWISFICQECNPTDRKTFRWTVAALSYAFTMTRGNNILALDRAEFSLLRKHVGNCVSLLISHFDILGARSSLEAKKEADRIETMRRLQQLQENLDDEFLPRTPSPSGQPRMDRSIRLTVEERLRLINELEQKRNEAAPQPVGTVLDEEVSEDRALVFLAASKSNISMRWQQGAYIGGGASGTVYLGYSLQDNAVFAVKILPTVDLQSSPALYESIKRESDVMSLLSHPNIVGFLGLEVHRNRVCLFQEYCEGGSLAGMLEYGKIDDEEVVGAFTIQLLRGLDYLHQNRIEHRDLKPENILIGANSVLKLADFGTAKIIKGNKTLARTRGGAHAKMEGLEGTPMYMAPEMIKNVRSNKLGSCDIWGLGCVVLQMITGRKPWSFLDFDNEWAIMFHLGATTEHPPLPEPNEMSELGIEWIEKCLSLEPDERPTAPELLDDEWLEPMLQQMAELEEDYPDVLANHETEAAPPPPEDLSAEATPSLMSDGVTPPLDSAQYEQA